MYTFPLLLRPLFIIYEIKCNKSDLNQILEPLLFHAYQIENAVYMYSYNM